MKSNLWIEKKRLVEQTLESTSIFQGNLLRVYLDRVSLPNNSTSSREWIAHPGACAVVPIFEDGSIMLVKQYRHAVEQIFLEVPAGKIDPREPPRDTAYRETEEETGLRPDRLAYVGHFYPVIGYSDEIIHIYAAWNLKETTERPDEDEFLITERVSYAEALKMIEKGIITDGKSICALYQTKTWWEKNEPFAVSF